VLPVDFPPVPNFQDHHGDSFILELANDSVVSNPVSPKALHVHAEGFSGMPRIRTAHDMFMQEVNDPVAGLGIQSSQLTLGGFLDFNDPGQTGIPVRPG